MSDEICIFCKIVNGDIPSTKLIETDNILAFMDINPWSEGHCLFIPKQHAEKLHDIDNLALGELLGAIKQVVRAAGFENYNVLQNNGEIANQVVKHAHFHLIPKPDANSGLKISWKALSDVDQNSVADMIKSKL